MLVLYICLLIGNVITSTVEKMVVSIDVALKLWLMRARFGDLFGSNRNMSDMQALSKAEYQAALV